MQNSVHQMKDCCGCGMCADACPKDAICMREDAYGFEYPAIDMEKCIKCGKCTQICAFTEPTEASLRETFLATSKDSVVKQHAASGGIFAEAAKYVLEKGGIVWGAAFDPDVMSVQHIAITRKEDIPRLQGSKYLQSNTKGIFKIIKQQLEQERTVLFSGTPCQCAALKVYVGGKAENLFLIDVVCHGVPSQSFFRYCIALEEKRNHGKLEYIQFRSKDVPWGNFVAKLAFRQRGKLMERNYIPAVFSYYKLFLGAKTYRESCYHCPFASEKRGSDWTICDYWGITEAHPELDENHLQEFQRGASGIIVNSEKGKRYFDEIRKQLITVESTFEKLAKHNEQLQHPVLVPEDRGKIMELIKANRFWIYDRNLHFQISLHELSYRIKKKLLGKGKAK